jgi:hypothetical protein
MQLRRIVGALSVVVLTLTLAATAQARTITLREFRLSDSVSEKLRDRHLDRLEAKYGANAWAPLRMELTNADLRLMGLPSKSTLLRQRYRTPTAILKDGTMRKLAAPRGDGKGPKDGGGSSGGGSGSGAAPPGVASYAGAGWFGIRPGAFLLLITEDSIGWCSMAHVYGAPGAYEISTAGHCGKPGDIATVIGVVGNNTPVLIDFGAFKVSHDNDLGDDWALISIRPEYQHLVTPTMAFWGGPRGMYTAQGDLAAVKLTGRDPAISLTPNPALAQQIVHYGHGVGLGQVVGTPRSGSAIAWRARHFMFFGAISNGDSGSGANTLTGDAAADNREAAGIITHLWIDPLMRDGLGIMGGTRATQVRGTLANGQIVPYPAPAPALP